MVAPGDRLEDLGYMAWSWCISAKTSRQPVDTQARQIGILAFAYEIDTVDRHNFFDSILERQTRNIQFWLGRQEKGISDADTAMIHRMIEWTTTEHAYTMANTRELRKYLT
jgi:aminoglycoside phosphotransferase (APT) family kinase protein